MSPEARENALLLFAELLGDMARPKPSKYVDAATGLHCHTCPFCKTVWQHPKPPLSLSDDCEERWHRCPRCGTEQRDKTELALVEHVDFPWTGGRK